jgi:hypothetical protein
MKVKPFMHFFAIILIAHLLIFSIVNCEISPAGTKSGQKDGTPDPTAVPTPGPTMDNYIQNISLCGGFEGHTKAISYDPTTYCDAEVMYWEYDGDTGLLSLMDARILLNCCGQHSIRVDRTISGLTVTEIDASMGGYRCLCTCVFDFGVDILDVPSGILSLRIMRDVTDSQKAPEVVWEGTLDLAACSGSIVIDNTPAGPWCGNR